MCVCVLAVYNKQNTLAYEAKGSWPLLFVITFLTYEAKEIDPLHVCFCLSSFPSISFGRIPLLLRPSSSHFLPTSRLMPLLIDQFVRCAPPIPSEAGPRGPGLAVAAAAHALAGVGLTAGEKGTGRKRAAASAAAYSAVLADVARRMPLVFLEQARGSATAAAAVAAAVIVWGVLSLLVYCRTLVFLYLLLFFTLHYDDDRITATGPD